MDSIEKKTYNSRNIKDHKGKLVALTFIQRDKKNRATITGEITAHDRDGILFNVNKSPKSEQVRNLHIDYERIIDIGKPEKAEK